MDLHFSRLLDPRGHAAKTLIRARNAAMYWDAGLAFATKRLHTDAAALAPITVRGFGALRAPTQGQVTRNQDRFPADFMFRLTRQEQTEVVANCDPLQGLKFSTAPPRAVTEHGAIMLAAVLSSPVAIHASVQIVRAFVQLREMLSGHRDLGPR